VGLLTFLVFFVVEIRKSYSCATPYSINAMNEPRRVCPQCGSTEIHFRKSRGDWTCDACEHKWVTSESSARHAPVAPPKVRLFLSYGRRDAEPLADRLEQDLCLFGYEVWRDRSKIRSGTDFLREIEDGLRSTQLVVALLSPHAVRRSIDPFSPDDLDSVCLDELSFARFACKTPIVPVMAVPCEPPFAVFRLDYVDMQQWLHSDDNYRAGLNRLREAIEAGLRGEVRYRTWDDRLRPWDFAAFLHEKRRDFSGRGWLFEQIEQWRQHRNERALLITGDPGVGKSAIVAELVHRNPGGQVLAYHCCQATTPETLRPDRFVRSLAAMIASKLPAYAERLSTPTIEENFGKDPVSAFEGAILTPLESLHAPGDGVRYLLIDALDEALAHPESLNIVTVLAAGFNRLPGWLRLVATTRNEAGVLRRGELSGLRAWEIDAQDPRNLDDIERFLAHRIGQPGLNERLTRSGVAANAAIRTLRGLSEGNFLWVQQALLGIERDLYRFDRLQDLPPGLKGLYFDFFQRRFPDEARYDAPRQVLQVVVAAAEPLTEAELARATGLDTEEVLPGALRDLAAFLPERDGRFVLYHKSIADWLTDPENRGTLHYASPNRGHERLADWCWAEYRQDSRGMSPYALVYLPAHLIESSRWDDLAALLLDLRYLETKAEAGRVFDLAMDFSRAVERIPIDHSAGRHLRLIEQALRSDLHFLARHPTALFQCLWNRCWWYDCPDAATHYDPPSGGWPAEGPPWVRAVPERLSTLLESWRQAKESCSPGFVWLRSIRPPELALASPQLACLRGHARSVRSVAYSPDGRRIVSGAVDHTVRVWDAASGAELACFRGHADRVTSVAYSPDGRRIVSGARDRTVRVWDAGSGAELACLRGHADWVRSVAYSPDGRRIVSGAEDQTVQVWDAHSGVELACLRGHAGQVWSVAYSPDGRRIVSGAADQTVRVWDAASGAELACLRGHVGVVRSVAYSPDGRRIISGSYDRTVRVWDAASGVALACLCGHADKVWSVAYSPDGRRIVSGAWDWTVRVWDAEKGVELACLRGHVGSVRSVAYSPDSRRIVSGARDQTVRVWDAAGGVKLACLRGHVDWAFSVAYSPDGRRIASGASDRTVRVWDAASGVELARLRGHSHVVHVVAYSPDSRRIVSGSDDQTLRVWDAASGVELACLRGHAGWVRSVAYSPDGRRIVSRSIDQTVRVWDAQSWECLAVIQGLGDIAPIAVARKVFPWRAMSRNLDTVIEPAGGGEAVAWFPAAMRNIATHPSGRSWAGSAGNHLYLILLEGEPDSRRPPGAGR